MSYRLTSYGKTRHGLPGMPWRDLSDEEYEAAVERHPGIEDKGYFVKVEEPGAAGAEPRGFVRPGGRKAAPIPSPTTISAEEAATEEVSNDGN